ncbi:hypothetical protein ACFSGX_12570 [Sphingomonas arantia]|uniref:Uncharacterized protein n=1 Tax=Sphingomonas arantia TaxID=1460676 RepID=A0ABW4TXZ7_9SPHN
MARRWSIRSLDPRHFTCRFRSRDILVQAIGNEHRPDMPDRPPILQPVYLRLGYGWRKNHLTEPFEPPSVALLRQLQAEDPALSFAWRVRQLRDCFRAEIRCAPDIGIGAGFHGDGPSQRAALSVAVCDAVRNWRHTESRRHLRPEMSTAEIDLLDAERMVMSSNLNGALNASVGGWSRSCLTESTSDQPLKINGAIKNSGTQAITEASNKYLGTQIIL